MPIKLVDRMREYLRLLCKGYTAKEIGHLMGVSPSTLREWRARIFKRYCIRGQVPLVLWARENGLG
ncbi:MAG: response regulator transcription factor [Flavobacteriales bacterium]|nr:response regulator transcription factor [Flavobacteriales bacterium]